jgi:tetratricopeptide (TPR) repeat protein
VESRAWYGLSSTQSIEGDQHAALDSATEAERLAQQAGATRELVAALEMKGRCLFRLGDASAALELGKRMLDLATEHRAHLQMSRSLNLIGAAHHALGRYDAAQKAWEDAFEIARELNDRRQMMSLLNNLGVIADYRGDQHTALARYQDALYAAREIGHRDGEIMFLGNVGEAHVRLGEFKLAEGDLREIIKMEVAAGSRHRAVTFTSLAEALLGQGHAAEALEAAMEALEMQQRAGDQALLAATWRVLGQVATRLSEPISIPVAEGADTRPYPAAECFAESIRICQEWSMEGERARTLREWAISEIQSGNYDEGVLKWMTARDLFDQLGADFEVAQMQEIPGGKLSVTPAESGIG